MSPLCIAPVNPVFVPGLGHLKIIKREIDKSSTNKVINRTSRRMVLTTRVNVTFEFWKWVSLLNF